MPSTLPKKHVISPGPARAPRPAFDREQELFLVAAAAVLGLATALVAVLSSVPAGPSFPIPW